MEDVKLPSAHPVYINVMESFVTQEVERQLKGLPERVCNYVKQTEVVTYALNRLPALYASSQKGWQYQCQVAERELQPQIQAAVRQAIAAVQVDPIRLSHPLQMPANEEAEAVLNALRSLFKTPDLDWATALKKLQTLQKNRQILGSKREGTHGIGRWQPGPYGPEVSWGRHRSQPPTPQGQSPFPLP